MLIADIRAAMCAENEHPCPALPEGVIFDLEQISLSPPGAETSQQAVVDEKGPDKTQDCGIPASLPPERPVPRTVRYALGGFIPPVPIAD